MKNDIEIHPLVIDHSICDEKNKKLDNLVNTMKEMKETLTKKNELLTQRNKISILSAAIKVAADENKKKSWKKNW